MVNIGKKKYGIIGTERSKLKEGHRSREGQESRQVRKKELNG